MPFITLRNNRNISIKNSKKNLEILSNLWMAIFYQAENIIMERFIYICNNVCKFYGDHILIFLWVYD